MLKLVKNVVGHAFAAKGIASGLQGELAELLKHLPVPTGGSPSSGTGRAYVEKSNSLVHWVGCHHCAKTGTRTTEPVATGHAAAMLYGDSTKSVKCDECSAVL